MQAGRAALLMEWTFTRIYLAREAMTSRTIGHTLVGKQNSQIAEIVAGGTGQDGIA
jgi:hypothetical protein